MNIRRAALADAKQIAEIYNFYIENTHHSFEIEPIISEEMQERIAATSENYPFLVAEEAGEILGYAYASFYKSRSAYKNSVEVSVYVKSNLKQKEIGTKLYERLFEELSTMKVHAIIAGIALPNRLSIKLHEKFGMEKVAHFREVGYKFGLWIDVGYWELINK
ncbi:MAG: N-acetyltransferase family protein [Acidobacteriota bacterium]|nr:N-acetyltransferase family protein [Acidobacteriota bacterium]